MNKEEREMILRQSREYRKKHFAVIARTPEKSWSESFAELSITSNGTDFYTLGFANADEVRKVIEALKPFAEDK